MRSFKKYVSYYFLISLTLVIPVTAQARIDNIHKKAAAAIEESEARANAAMGRGHRGAGGRSSSRAPSTWRNCPVNSECWKEFMKNIDETLQKTVGPNSPIIRQKIPNEAQ